MSVASRAPTSRHRLAALTAHPRRVRPTQLSSSMQNTRKFCAQSAASAKSRNLGEVGIQILTILGAATFVLSWFSFGATGRVSELLDDRFETATASRGTLEHVVEATGQIRCYRPEVVRSECRWTREIIELVPEGTKVEKGDVICRLECAYLQDRANQRQVSLIRAQADLEAARADDSMQDAINERNLDEARLEADLAAGQLEAYRDAEYEQQLVEFGGREDLSREALGMAQQDYEYECSLSRQGLNTTQNVERARTRLARAERELALASSRQQLFEQFEHPRRILSLEALAARTDAEVDRTHLRNERSSISSRRYVLSRQVRVNIYKRSYERYANAVKACTMRAPCDGEVMHANSWSLSSRGTNLIEVGRSVRLEQPVFSIVNRSRLKFKGSISDRLAPYLHEGSRAFIRSESLPGKTFPGTLTWVAPMPRTSSSSREYRYHDLEVVLDGDGQTGELSQLTLRTSVEADILVEKLDSVLKIPTAAIVQHDGEMVTIVKSAAGLERRVLQVGYRTDEDIEITSGLRDGDEVVTGNPEDLRALSEQLL